MTGKIEEVPLPDLLQLFHTSKKNGVLVVTDDHEGKIYLRQGRVYYAVIDDNHELGPAEELQPDHHLGEGRLRAAAARQPGVHGRAGPLHRGAADGRAAAARRVQAHRGPSPRSRGAPARWPRRWRRRCASSRRSSSTCCSWCTTTAACSAVLDHSEADDVDHRPVHPRADPQGLRARRLKRRQKSPMSPETPRRLTQFSHCAG